MAEGHRERLKDRFLNEGLDHFEDHTLLELLMFFSVPRSDTNPLGHTLMRRFGSLSNVFDAPIDDLMSVDGIGRNSAILIKMIPQICKRYRISHDAASATYVTKEELADVMRPYFLDATVEKVYILCLSPKMRIICCEMLAEGDPGCVTIDTRKILEVALRSGADAVTIAHNHPNGTIRASHDDLVATKVLEEVFGPLGIRFWDHFLFANGEVFSVLSQCHQQKYTT